MYRYLSQGTTMQALAWTFHTGHSTIHYVIHETCKALWDVPAPQYLKTPESGISLIAWEALMANIVVLLATCDYKYKFTFVDIGAYGSQSDGGVFANSVFGQRLENNTMNIPPEQVLPGTNLMIPYFFVGDECFLLKTYIMRPYPGQNLSTKKKIFNYRLSRARQVIENTFGILVAWWRILKTSINADIENVDNIVKAAVVFHNYCQTELSSLESNIYCSQNFVDSDGRENGG
nr:unnamed protein product [Callosobruchus chinensis]